MKRPNLYDRLKVIAILAMIVDHVGYLFFPQILWLRLLGRVAFPIFLFLVGFNGSYRWRWDLLLYAIAIQIPIFISVWYFYYGTGVLNILFGIVIGRVALGWLGKRDQSPFLLIVITIVLLVIHPWLAILRDYGSFVMLFPIAGWMMRTRQIAASGDAMNRHLYFSQGQLEVLIYLIVCFATLFGYTQTIFGFSILQLCILGSFFILLLCIFFVLGQGNRFLPVTKKIDTGVLFVSKNALLIYVFHLLVLGLIKILLLRK